MSLSALTHRAVLAIALPVMFSNVSTPLIGLVDTAIVGQLTQAYYIGAVAVGALIFDFIFWGFGFLRMATTGFAAQARGAGERTLMHDILVRALMLAGLAGAALIVLQPLIASVAFGLLEASPEVERYGREYFDIRIWGAPAALASYAFNGWFIGIGKARLSFYLLLLVNSLNIALDAWFVLGLGMSADGVALGTVMAEYTGTAVALAMVFVQSKDYWRTYFARLRAKRLLDAGKLKQLMAANFDIMVRSLSLVFAFSWFTAKSASEGDIILAANTVLFNFFTVSAYLLDGYALAAEALVGQSLGARNRARFWQAVRISSAWALVLSGLVSVLFYAGGGLAIDLLSTNVEVRETARVFLVWAALCPVIGVACFQLDGIFIGATWTRDMRNMMIISLVVYLGAWQVLTSAFGNHGLWGALLVFFIIRAITLGARLPVLARKAFGQTG